MAPAQASATVDHRTVGNQGELLHWWTSQPEIDALHTLIDLPAVWTPAETPWLGKADVSTLALLKAAAVKWLPLSSRVPSGAEIGRGVVAERSLEGLIALDG